MLDEYAREKIWRKHFSAEAPRKEIDFEFLARQFKQPGGNIRNVVLASAFAAAEDGTAIGMEHVIPAVEAEYQKQGKLLRESELGPCLHLSRRRAARGADSG